MKDVALRFIINDMTSRIRELEAKNPRLKIEERDGVRVLMDATGRAEVEMLRLEVRDLRGKAASKDKAERWGLGVSQRINALADYLGVEFRKVEPGLKVVKKEEK